MTALPLPLLHKEVRALVPWWGAAVIMMTWCWALPRFDLVSPALDTQFLIGGMVAYASGALILGALSVGHEFNHLTLTSQLAQPTTRSRLLLAKSAALLLVLAALVGVAAITTMTGIPRPRWAEQLVWLTVSPLVLGLGLAPWLTMVCRGALAGAVFAAALTVLGWAAGVYMRVEMTQLLRGTVVAATLCIPFAWRAFTRLQVPGGPQAEVDLLSWARDRPQRTSLVRQHPLWLAAKKEMRVQQMTLVVGAIYVALWTIVTLTNKLVAGALPTFTLYAVTMLYGGLVSLMPGALACAEERRFGTAEWQHLLPLAFWKQWTLKVTVAVSLALVLAVALPEVLNTLSPDPALTEGFHPGAAVLLCICAIYLSSLSKTGLHALLATPPVVMASYALLAVLIWPVIFAVRPVIEAVADILHPVVSVDREAFRWWRTSYIWETAVAFFVLRFAAHNFRTLDHAWSRIRRQATVALGILAAGVACSMLLSALFQRWLATAGSIGIGR